MFSKACFRVHYGKRSLRAIKIWFLNEVIKKSNRSDGASKLPQHSKFLTCMSLPCHPGGDNWFKQQFWNAAGFRNPGQQANLYTEPFWSQEATEKKKKKIPWLRNLSYNNMSHISNICHIIHITNISNKSQISHKTHIAQISHISGQSQSSPVCCPVAFPPLPPYLHLSKLWHKNPANSSNLLKIKHQTKK